MALLVNKMLDLNMGGSLVFWRFHGKCRKISCLVVSPTRREKKPLEISPYVGVVVILPGDRRGASISILCLSWDNQFGNGNLPLIKDYYGQKAMVWSGGQLMLEN